MTKSKTPKTATPAPRFVNTSERYGEHVTATLADYQELNPGGKFEQAPDGLYEWVIDPQGEERRVKVAEVAK